LLSCAAMRPSEWRWPDPKISSRGALIVPNRFIPLPSFLFTRLRSRRWPGPNCFLQRSGWACPIDQQPTDRSATSDPIRYCIWHQI